MPQRKYTRDQLRASLARAVEAPGKVTATTERMLTSDSERDSSKNISRMGVSGSTTVGESKGPEFQRIEMVAPPKKTESQIPVDEERTTETVTETREGEEPYNVTVPTAHGPRQRVKQLATDRRQRRPPNYKLHVLTALGLALAVRVTAYGAKAVFGGK